MAADFPEAEHDVSDPLLARFDIYKALVAMVLQADPRDGDQRSLPDIQLLSHWRHVHCGGVVCSLSSRHHLPVQVSTPEALQTHTLAPIALSTAT